MRVLTLRSYLARGSYGYETTQAYRHKLLDRLGIPNSYVVVTPLADARWTEKFSWMGFDLSDVIVLPHRYSDVPDRPFGVPVNVALEEWPGAIPVTQTADHMLCLVDDGYLDLILEDGLVVSANVRDRNQQLRTQTNFTTKKFVTLDLDTLTLTYYNADGSVALTCKAQDDRGDGLRRYRYERNGHEFTTNEMVRDFLEEQTVPGDVVILDQSQNDFGLGQDFGAQRDVHIWPFIHFNAKHFYETHKGTEKTRESLRLPQHAFIASPYPIPWLRENLGIDSIFMPPIGVDVREEPPEGIGSNRCCMVGHLMENKRVPIAIDAFRELPELELDVYGGSEKDAKELAETCKLPPNVHLMGAWPSEDIPRERYCCYVSCSKSEMFANAMVEACAVGLIPVVSNVDFGHRQYVREIGCETAFDDVEGLREKLRMVASWDLETRRAWSNRTLEWARRFSREEVDRLIPSCLEQAIEYDHARWGGSKRAEA